MKGFWGFFPLHFFLWKVGFFLEVLLNRKLLNTPSSFSFRSLEWVIFSLAFLPSLFLSHSEILLLLPSLYYLIQGDPLYLRTFQSLKTGFLFPLFPSLHFKTTSWWLSSFWLQHLKRQDDLLAICPELSAWLCWALSNGVTQVFSM